MSIGQQEPAILSENGKPFNDWLRAELQEYKERHQLSMGDLAQELGRSSTQVSKYLSGKAEGDVERFEALVDDVLRNDMKRIETRAKLKPCMVASKVNAFCETVRKRNDVGLLHGDAGLGKTSGGQLYAAINPTAVFFTVKRFHVSSQHMINLLWDKLKPDHQKWTNTRWDFVIEKLRGSNRLLIFDNCHKLTRCGIDMIFDIHDETEVPIALIGNKEILERVKLSEQNYSRIGYVKELKLEHPRGQKMSDAKELAEIVMEQYAPEAADELQGLAIQVLEQAGHGRALRKQLLLAADIRENTHNKLSWTEAFRAAHTRLIRNYELPVEKGAK